MRLVPAINFYVSTRACGYVGVRCVRKECILRNELTSGGKEVKGCSLAPFNSVVFRCSSGSPSSECACVAGVNASTSSEEEEDAERLSTNSECACGAGVSVAGVNALTSTEEEEDAEGLSTWATVPPLTIFPMS